MMMREILFRGKRIDNGEWVCGDLIQSGEKHRPIDREDIPFSNSYIIRKTTPSYTDGCLKGCEWFLSSHAVHVDPATVGQYTGLKDKNGKRIFEGDVLKCTDRYGHYVLYTVAFKDGSFMLKQNGVDYYVHFDGFPLKFYQFEVIGKIHDSLKSSETFTTIRSW